MLVCNVSLLRRRASIAVDLAEAAAALDAPGTGNVIFAALVDDPASVGDHVDAFLGEIMLEAASAVASVNAGFAYAAAIVEAAVAGDLPSASMPTVLSATMVEAAIAADAPSASVLVSAAVVETTTPVDTPSATITGAPTATWDPATVTAVTLSGGNLVATNTGTTSANQGARVATSSGKTTGKYYFEVTYTTLTGGGNLGFGIGTTASTYTNMGGSATVGNVSYRGGTIYANGSSSGLSLGNRSQGDVIGIAIDLDNRKAWFRVAPSGNWNGQAIGSQNPATNTGGVTIPAGTMVPFCVYGGSLGAAGNVDTANFGASAFTGAVPSGFASGWPA